MTSLGDYDEFTVTLDSVAAFIQRFLTIARSSPHHAAFVQLGVGTVVEGIDLFCCTEPDFRCVLRLPFPEAIADEIQPFVQGYHSRRGDAGWDVTFYSPDDPIADVLYRVLREVVECKEGFETDGYYADPESWDRVGEDPRQPRIEAANKERQPLQRLFDFLQRLDEAGIWYRVDSGDLEIEVQVRVPDERYEFRFLPDGDVIYTRFTLANNMISIYDDEGTGIMDELVALYGIDENGDAPHPFDDEQRLRTVYGQTFDESLRVLWEHDPLGIQADKSGGARWLYVFALAELLPEIRYMETEQVAFLIMEQVFSRIEGWERHGPHEQLMHALWNIWSRYRAAIRGS